MRRIVVLGFALVAAVGFGAPASADPGRGADIHEDSLDLAGPLVHRPREADRDRAVRAQIGNDAAGGDLSEVDDQMQPILLDLHGERPGTVGLEPCGAGPDVNPHAALEKGAQIRLNHAEGPQYSVSLRTF